MLYQFSQNVTVLVGVAKLGSILSSIVESSEAFLISGIDQGNLALLAPVGKGTSLH